MIGADNGLVGELALALGAERLAAIQAHAATVVAEEEADARAAHAGDALLDRLDATAALHLIVGGLLLQRIAHIEDHAPPVVDRSSGLTRYLAPMRRRYTRLRVLGRAGRDRAGQTLYLVSCACGSPPFKTLGRSLRWRKTKSCGCLRNEAFEETKRLRRRLLERAAGRKAA